MYVILVYDFEKKRVAKALKTCRQYLNWVQNSVFEGEITQAQLKELQLKLKIFLKKEKDSVIFFKLRDNSLIKKEIMGLEKNTTDSFL